MSLTGDKSFPAKSVGFGFSGVCKSHHPFFPAMLTVLVAVLWALTSTLPAAAQSSTCRSLQAQMAQLNSQTRAAPSQKYLQYDRAVRDQNVQIQKTERAARNNGCQLLRTNTCKRINSSLSKMYANLSSLESQRERYAGDTSSTDADRNFLLRAMRQNNCGGEKTIVREATVEPDKPRRRTLLEQIFGNKTYTNEGAISEYDPNQGTRYGTYRTLCVRTCDGYYFPISFSTTQERFETDSAKCQQMCPGTETRLFFHPMPGGDAENSISYPTEVPYASLDNAFAYRKVVNPECSCKFSANMEFQEIAGAEFDPDEADAQPELRIAKPVWRVDPNLDLQTQENIDGGLTMEKLASIASGGDQISDTTKTGEIRIVGPSFFPVQ